MSEDRCECCDLPVAMCSRNVIAAQEAAERALRLRWLQVPGVVAAAYGGRCPGCRESFKAGTPVKRTEDGWLNVLCCGEGLDQ